MPLKHQGFGHTKSHKTWLDLVFFVFWWLHLKSKNIDNSANIEKRKPIWNTLSEFYLDTELQSDDYDRIAELFKNSGYSLTELKEIDLYEVFPLLQVNLLSVAGEWAGFDEAWLNTECEKNYTKRKNPLLRIIRRFKNKIHYWMREEHWKEIEKRLK